MEHKIAVCGSGNKFSEKSTAKALAIGKEIAEHGAVLLTGSSRGLPLAAAKGAKEAGGMVNGISPAKDMKEHAEKYGFTTDCFDEVEYTGHGIPGRNFDLVGKSDAVIVVGGMAGTLNELTIALIEHKIVGILEGTGGIADRAREIIGIIAIGDEKVFYGQSPAELVEKIMGEIGKSKQQ